MQIVWITQATSSIRRSYITTTPMHASQHTRMNTSSFLLILITSSDMPSLLVTRAALKSVNSHAARRWLPAQMAAALHRVVTSQCNDRAATKYVNASSSEWKPHVLSRASLQRMFATLPEPLTLPDTSSEALLLQHIHSTQSARQVGRI